MDNYGFKEFDAKKSSSYEKNGNIWLADTLRTFARKKGYKEFDLPLAGINLNVEAFTMHSLRDFIFNVKRCNNCDLNDPIILDNNGAIADGYHRIALSILNDKESIKAIRLKEMPKPDFSKKDIEDLL